MSITIQANDKSANNIKYENGIGVVAKKAIKNLGSKSVYNTCIS